MSHYDTLGVKKTATPAEIKDAYKSLVKKYHPDIYQGDKSYAEKKIKEINVAYDVLSDPKQKQEYDESITPKQTAYSSTYSQPKTSNYYQTNYYSTNRNSYASQSKYSYENYKKTYDRQNSYDYSKRYTNYHRSKTPNSNYTTQESTQFTDRVANVFDAFSTKNKIIIVSIFIILYIVFIIASMNQLSSITNSKEQSSSTSNSSVRTTTGSSSSNTHKRNNYSNTVTNENSTQKSLPDDYDINDYFTDAQLLEVYNNYYSNDFSTFLEFKKIIAEYFYYQYVKPYN